MRTMWTGRSTISIAATSGSLRFLRNIVLLPGCGQFLPEASFLVRPVTGDRPIAMILTSTVAEGVGHTTQVCVMPGIRGTASAAS